MTRGIGAVLTAVSLALLLHASFASGSRITVFALSVAATLWVTVQARLLFRARRRVAAVRPEVPAEATTAVIRGAVPAADPLAGSVAAEGVARPAVSAAAVDGADRSVATGRC